MDDEDKVAGRMHGEQFAPETSDGLVSRVVFIVLIGVMMSVSQTVLWVVTLIQLVIRVTNDGQPNERLADFGTDLGVWMAKAVRYMTGASEVKPWPWSELD